MARPKITWNIKAFEQIRRLSTVDRMLAGSAQSIASACGPGYEAEQGAGQTRSRAAVLTVTPEAMADCAANNTLINHIDAGRV